MADYIESVGNLTSANVPNRSTRLPLSRAQLRSRTQPQRDPLTGFSSDYVYSETKRASEALKGFHQTLAGIDIESPRLQATENATRRYQGSGHGRLSRGADGVILLASILR